MTTSVKLLSVNRVIWRSIQRKDFSSDFLRQSQRLICFDVKWLIFRLDVNGTNSNFCWVPEFVSLHVSCDQILNFNPSTLKAVAPSAAVVFQSLLWFDFPWDSCRVQSSTLKLGCDCWTAVMCCLPHNCGCAYTVISWRSLFNYRGVAAALSSSMTTWEKLPPYVQGLSLKKVEEDLVLTRNYTWNQCLHGTDRPLVDCKMFDIILGKHVF